MLEMLKDEVGQQVSKPFQPYVYRLVLSKPWSGTFHLSL